MFRNMANSLFEHEEIVTTVAKAKELRPFVEKIITVARHGSAVNRNAKELREKASEYDKRATDLLDEARRLGTDTDKGKRALDQRKQVLKERYEVLAEWRRAVAPVLHARRRLIARLGNHRIQDDDHASVIAKLIDDIGPRYADRPGGYTRIVRMSKWRLGDAAPTAMISLVTQDGGPARRKKRAGKEAASAGKK
jgi:large subunit ribosomal protein L17